MDVLVITILSGFRAPMSVILTPCTSKRHHGAPARYTYIGEQHFEVLQTPESERRGRGKAVQGGQRGVQRHDRRP